MLFQKVRWIFTIKQTEDKNLELFIDKIEPEAPWLKKSPYSPTEIEGAVPHDDAGKTYLISLRATNTTGGNSDVVQIPLSIDINPSRTPQFYHANPQFPTLNTGQKFEHDFVANNDIFPEFSDFPYAVELAKGYDNPSWVRIETNKLIIDEVPDDPRSRHPIFITIRNIPGGISEVYQLNLFIFE